MSTCFCRGREPSQRCWESRRRGKPKNLFCRKTKIGEPNGSLPRHNVRISSYYLVRTIGGTPCEKRINPRNWNTPFFKCSGRQAPARCGTSHKNTERKQRTRLYYHSQNPADHDGKRTCFAGRGRTRSCVYPRFLRRSRAGQTSSPTCCSAFLAAPRNTLFCGPCRSSLLLARNAGKFADCSMRWNRRTECYSGLKTP